MPIIFTFVMYSPDSNQTSMEYLLDELMRLLDKYAMLHANEATREEKKQLRIKITQVQDAITAKRASSGKELSG